MTEYNLRITLKEFILRSDMPTQTVVEYIEHGIIEPEGDNPETWLFTTDMVPLTQRASRLRQDLGLNWAGLALALDLLSQRDQLRVENEQLRRRLERFLIEE